MSKEQFQFTPLREGRRRQGNPRWATETISIHAPPRGATGQRWTVPAHVIPFQFTPLREGRPLSVQHQKRQVNFNSRPSARGDASSVADINRKLISIHAPPRGATPCSKWFERSADDFNSRPSARGDSDLVETQNVVDVFQFTPLREGRRKTLCRGCHSTSFQFTPLREGRRTAM